MRLKIHVTFKKQAESHCFCSLQYTQGIFLVFHFQGSLSDMVQRIRHVFQTLIDAQITQIVCLVHGPLK